MRRRGAERESTQQRSGYAVVELGVGTAEFCPVQGGARTAVVIDLTIDLILAPALQQHFRVRPTLGLKSLRKSQIQTIAFYLGFIQGNI